MMAMIAMLLMAALFLGPLGWRVWLDRRLAQAERIAAEIRAGVNRRLHGESMLGVQVAPRYPWSSGRVVLSVPSGYEWLITAAWPGLLPRVPAGYDLVVKLGDAIAPRVLAEPTPRELRRAA